MKINGTPWRNTLLIIMLVILIPVLSYSVFQFNRLSETERLITEIYERQLNGILFSLNQHSWDVMSRLTVEIKKIAGSPATEAPAMQPDFHALFQQNPFLKGIAVQFAPEKTILITADSSRETSPVPDEFRNWFDSKAPHLIKLEKQARQNYEKIESFSLPGAAPLTLQLFAWFPQANRAEIWFGGMLVDDHLFGQEILSRKINEIQSTEFIFAVRHRSSGEIIFASQTLPDLHFEQAQAFWLFPDLDLVIRSTGPTISEMARSRTRTNLIFLGGMNLVLLGGLLVLLKTISTQLQLAKMKSDFVSNVSHELRTPLALIRMFAETLEMGRVPSEEKKRRYYQIIASETNRLTRMINNILDFSKIEAGKKSFNPAWTDLRQLVEEVLASYAYHLEQKGFTVGIHLAGSLPRIYIDPEAVAQAMINILENAAKYSPETKSIEVRLAQRGREIILSITDQGIGIPKQLQRKIFEKFFRASDSLVHDTKGSGLGLTLVKYIMDFHKGRVEVESAPGKGSRFSLIFPITKEELACPEF